MVLTHPLILWASDSMWDNVSPNAAWATRPARTLSFSFFFNPTALRCLLTSGETAPTSVTWHDAKGAEILSSERYTVSQTAYTTGRLTATLLSLAPAEDCSYTCTASFASGDLVGFVNLDLVGRLYLYLPVHFCDWLPLSS